MRTLQITDAGTVKILNEKQVFVVENQNILKEMTELETRFNKNIGQTKRSDEKARIKLKKQLPKLDEYEQVSRVFEEGGDWYFEIADRMEEFKKAFETAQK
jgi:Skp family chaperone for outer membrane proteins